MVQHIQITTDWVHVATEGNTVDGRKLEAQDLIDMAETYSPDIYEANIWRDHERYFDTHGIVLEASHDVDKLNRVRLLVKLNPNFRYLRLSEAGMANYFSIEINRKLNENGKAYLDGLAALQEPASQGLKSVRMYTKHHNLEKSYSDEPMQIDESFKQKLLPTDSLNLGDDKNQDEIKSQFTKLMGLVFGNKDSNPKTKTEEDDMFGKEEQEKIEARFTRLEEMIQGVATGMTGLTEKFSALKLPKAPEGDGGSEEEEPGEEAEQTLEEKFAALESKNDELEEKLKSLEKEPSGSTKFGENKGDKERASRL